MPDPDNQKLTPEARKLLTATWAKIAQQEEVFQYPKSDADTLEGVFKDFGLGFVVTDNRLITAREREKHGVVQKWIVQTTLGARAHVFRNRDGDIWVDASALQSTKSRGTALYAGLLNYAYNTQGRLVGDPNGVSDMAIFRRTENMLASALKFGTTKHMLPATEQQHPGLFIGLDGHTDGVTENFVPLAWSNNDLENLANLLKVSHAQICKLVPEVQNAYVDFNTGNFYWQDSHRPVERGDFERMSRALQRALGSHTEGMGDDDTIRKNLGSSGDARRPPGSATLQRHIITHSLLRAARSQDGGRSELAAIGSELRRRLGEYGQGLAETGSHFPRILYSLARTEETVSDLTQTATPGQHAPGEGDPAANFKLSKEERAAQRSFDFGDKPNYGGHTAATLQERKERNEPAPEEPALEAAPRGEDHSAARVLNWALARKFDNPDWRNAYTAASLPEGMAALQADFEAAFGRTIHPVMPTAERFNSFGGVYLPEQPGKVFVNVRRAHETGFLQLAGHELLHDLKRDRPDLYHWFVAQADQYLTNVEDYRQRLNVLSEENGIAAHSLQSAKEELIADFTGDALADTQFLGQLAKSDSNRFTSLVQSVSAWFDKLGAKLRGRGMKSAQHVKDVDGLRKHLGEVLIAYVNGKEIEDLPRYQAQAKKREGAFEVMLHHDRRTNELVAHKKGDDLKRPLKRWTVPEGTAAGKYATEVVFPWIRENRAELVAAWEAIPAADDNDIKLSLTRSPEREAAIDALLPAMSADEMVMYPLSETWPETLIDGVEDDEQAAVLHVLRTELARREPPMAHGDDRHEWAQRAANTREYARRVMRWSPKDARDDLRDGLRGYSADHMEFLGHFPREYWPRIDAAHRTHAGISMSADGEEYHIWTKDFRIASARLRAIMDGDIVEARNVGEENHMERSKEFYKQVAEKLIAQLEAGTAPWQKPWDSAAASGLLPMNFTTGKRYRGINAVNLMMAGHSDPRWMTYKQAQGIGAQVRRGEKGTPIQHWKYTYERDKLDDDGQPVLDANGKPVKETVRLSRPQVFFSTVFHASQIDGLPPLQAKEITWNPSERASAILTASGAKIEHSPSDQAFYRPSTDTITLPLPEQFHDAAGYYATALHELGHWTGHESRLGRDIRNPFGSVEYAKEELRAEISSMILGDELGIGHDPAQHAAYVGHWIKILKDDPSELYRAASDAEEIFHYVLALEQQQEQTQEQAQAQEQVAQPVEQEQAQVQTQAPQQQPEQAEQAEQNQTQEQTNMAARKTDVKAERIWLDVPWTDKDEAKRLGAKWDGQEKAWYVPAGVEPKPFEKWLDVARIEAADEQQQARAQPPELTDEETALVEELRAARANPDAPKEHIVAGDVMPIVTTQGLSTEGAHGVRLPLDWNGEVYVEGVVLGRDPDEQWLKENGMWEEPKPDAWGIAVGRTNSERVHLMTDDEDVVEALAARLRIVAEAVQQPQQEQQQQVAMPRDWDGAPLEIQAKVMSEDGVNVVPAEQSDTEPEFWGVYARLQDGTSEWLQDFDTQEEAQRFAQTMVQQQAQPQTAAQKNSPQQAALLHRFTRRQKDGSSTVGYVANERAQNRFARADFRDFGQRIDVRNWRDETVTLAALQLAAQKWGAVKLTGSEKYREMATRLADEHGIPVLNAVRTEGMNKPKAEELAEATAQQTQAQPSEQTAQAAQPQAQAAAQSEQRKPKAQSANPAPERVDLNVPYAEREAAKRAGAKWDKEAKTWYAPKGADLDKLARWNTGKAAKSETPPRPEEEFAEALRSVGCIVDGEHPIMDGNKHRIKAEGDKAGEESGFYVGYLDGKPAGYVRNNRTGAEIRWKSKGYSVSPENYARLKAQSAAKLAARDEEQQRLREASAERVRQEMRTWSPVTEATPYMRNKGIAPCAGVFADAHGNTHVPGMNVEGVVQTEQSIPADGKKKRFAKDSSKTGCFHPIDGNLCMDKLDGARTIIIAEGFATAGTIYQAGALNGDAAVVAAFDAGNLKPVAEALHAKYPDKPIIIAGDDDVATKLTQGVNPGREKALEAARAVGGEAIFPNFCRQHEVLKGVPAITPELAKADKLSDEQLAALQVVKQYSDFNDLAASGEDGRALVQMQIRKAVNKALTGAQTQQRQQRQAMVEAQIEARKKQNSRGRGR